MAYTLIDEDVIYSTAGAALPSVINNMVKSLLNDDLATSYHTINQVI
jgi:hypothetical protein